MEFNKFGEKFELPFTLHIKDIKQDFLSVFGTSSENVIEEYSADLYKQYEDSNLIDYNISLLQFVDLKTFALNLTDEEIKEYGEIVEKYKDFYIFKNHFSLYSFLVNLLKFNDVDFKIIELFIRKSQKKLMENYEKMLKDEIDIGNPKDTASESYMFLRCAFELNRPPLFAENKGLSIEEHSWREIITQRVYMGRKCEIEKIQMDNMEKKRNKMNKK
ncbi:MAG: hypothetical protein ACRC1T_09195 [Clostridium chrysemydis]|uniref:hypothetical protein n=1 Tax=Clostridium chrysemydis TaxID=2665504 RepID=UPI003F3C82AC